MSDPHDSNLRRAADFCRDLGRHALAEAISRAIDRIAALEAELAERTASERLSHEIADRERERREAAEELLTEARFYMAGHYDFIKPNGGLRDLMCMVDKYFGNQSID
mgnify:CR=1 FL=1